jgi:beta-galactosidase
MDLGWRFSCGDFPAAISSQFDDQDWRVLDVPHDWSIEATPNPDNPAQAGCGYFPGGIGWYRRQIEIPSDLGTRHVLIEFDGVYMNSEVWCNGHFCGVRPYGYSSFCYDLTPFIKAGEPASIAVRVDNSRQKNSRWYSGSGIYRHVWLTLAAPVRVDHWGTYVTTPRVESDAATVRCEVMLVNDTPDDVSVDVTATVQNTFKSACCTLPPVSRQAVALELTLDNPRVWSPDTPELYTLQIALDVDGQGVDRYDTRFGIRTIRFDATDGFFLNGRSIKLKGVNEHHDAGCLGAAIPDDVLRRRLRILKQMGCNAIRIAHNPASPTLLDLCDEYGFMVVEDAFDEWKDGKTPFGYQLYWDQWWERDLTDMIRRDRNHPCIVMWSVGNEIKEVREGRPEGLPIMRDLQALCHREDPSRPMTCGCCNSRETLAAGYARYMDVFGYNGGGGGCFDYEKDHAAYPALPMFASEHPHTLQTRGVYRTKTWYRDLQRNPDNVRWYRSPRGEANSLDLTSSEQKDRPLLDLMHIPDLTETEVFDGVDPHYQSSYGNAVVRMSIFDSWYRTRTLPFFCGEFRWTGFDYLGECYRWPAKSWNFGIIDLCGFPKDAYYFLQSQWTPKPMVHVLPHWTWPGLEGTVIPVIAYSNCERVELFLNGTSLGVREMDDARMFARWDVPYAPGELKAVGMRSAERAMGNGDDPVTCVHETAGAAARLRMTCDEKFVRADRTGIGHLEITIVDADGRRVPHANPSVTVTVEGPARLIGLENGDPIDSTNYKLNHRKAFNGMLLAIMQAGDTQGTITIKAQADGMEPAAMNLPCF